MRLVDTHCHLDDDQFDTCRADVIARAVSAGVEKIVCVGTTAASSLKCIDLSHQYAPLHAAVGIQPNHCDEAEPGDWQTIVELSSRDRVVALGETGLDRYWKHVPFPTQQDYFDRHLRLSQRLDLPFIVHMRDCDQDVLEMLREAHGRGPLRGVMHSFTGELATAEEAVALGLYISFAGMITYKKSEALRAVAARVPLDRILVETDAPYLSPHPVRGQRPNEPALVVHTACCIAESRGIPAEDFAAIVSDNAYRLFRFTE